ncbi:MAG: hypothetical protein HGA45_13425 [Chloroflexales bacterium]|nr:hypothetical protein [Chloroflexales bacterium]
MASPTLIRWSGLTALLGSIIGIVTMPLLALAYFATADGAASLEAPWVAAWTAVAQPLLAPLLTFGPPDVVYTVYGLLMLPMVLGFLVGLLGLHAIQAHHAGRLEHIGFWLSLVGMSLLACGIVGAYGVGALDGSFVTLILPGFFLLLIGPLVFGLGTLRARVAPRLGAWLLILGSFPGIIGLSILVGHNASGLLVLALAWIVLGWALWTHPGLALPPHRLQTPEQAHPEPR